MEVVKLCEQVNTQSKKTVVRAGGVERGELAQKQTSLCCCSTTWAESLGTASDATPPAWHSTAASGLNTRLLSTPPLWPAQSGSARLTALSKIACPHKARVCLQVCTCTEGLRRPVSGARAHQPAAIIWRLREHKTRTRSGFFDSVWFLQCRCFGKLHHQYVLLYRSGRIKFKSKESNLF